MQSSRAAGSMGRCAGLLSAAAGGGPSRRGTEGPALPRDLAETPPHRIDLSEAAWLAPEGDEADTLYRVESGVLMAVQGAPDRDPQIAEFYYPGDVILPAASNGRAPALRSLGRASLDAWNLAALREGAGGRTGFAYALFELARDDLSKRLERSERMRRLGVEARFATFLLEAARRLGRATEGRLALSLPMSRYEIANYLGLRTETLCRVIRRWRDDGLIALDGPRRIEIRDCAALGRLAAAGAQTSGNTSHGRRKPRPVRRTAQHRAS